MLPQLTRQDDQAHHCEGLAGLLWAPGLSPCTHLKVGILIFPSQPWSPASFTALHGPSPLHSNRRPVSLSEYIQRIPTSVELLDSIPGSSLRAWDFLVLWLFPSSAFPLAQLWSSSTVCSPGLFHSCLLNCSHRSAASSHSPKQANVLFLTK